MPEPRSRAQQTPPWRAARQWLKEPEGWNAAFNEYNTQLTSRTARLLLPIIAASAVLLWPVDVLLDDPGSLVHLAYARIGVATIGALGWVTLRFPPGPVARHPGWTTGAFLAAGVLFSSWQLGQAGGLDRPWFYLSYATIPITVVLQVGLTQRVVINLSVVAAHATGFILGHPSSRSDPNLVRALVFLVFEAGIVCVVGHQMLHLTRRAWTQTERANALVANILPAPIAARLQAGEQPVADAVANATVLFADIEGFTPFADAASPVELVDLLNEVFTTLDQLAARHGVEKIKTIGDAYMAAAGVSSPRGDHLEAVCALALDMVNVMASVQAGGGMLAMRVGVQTGPVVAGVIGLHKYAFDLWGDTVNTASRMEHTGEAGRVHVTQQVKDKLGPGWRLEERGLIKVKGKGELRTYWLLGRE